jgi:hypothetical protein
MQRIKERKRKKMPRIEKGISKENMQVESKSSPFHE